jgi:hypothetical protein
MKVVTQTRRVEAESAWVDPDFRRLFRASALSVFGSEIGELALPLLASLRVAARHGLGAVLANPEPA